MNDSVAQCAHGRPRGARAGIAIVVLWAVLATGCFDFQQAAPEKRSFALEIERPGAARGETRDITLGVRRFRVSPRFAGRGLVYRTSDVSFESDFYNEFLIAPGANLAEETRRWLSRSGLFARVVDARSQAASCLTLEAEIPALYGDLRSAPQARIEAHFYVLRDGDTIVFDRTYTQNAPVAKSDDPGEIVRAHNAAFSAVLRILEEDLAGAVDLRCLDEGEPAR